MRGQDRDDLARRTGPGLAGRTWDVLVRIATPLRGSAVRLVLGMVVVVALGWAFGEMAEAVIHADDVVALDSPVTRWVVDRRTPWLTQVLQVVTALGSAWFLILLLVVVTIVLVAGRHSWSVVALPIVSAAGAAILVTTIKLLIARPRPTLGAVVATADGFAFPSGHSAQAVATYGVLAWLVAHLAARRTVRVGAWLSGVVLIGLIGFSRLYLGVHWLSDVIGGYIIGAAWAVVAVTAMTATDRATGAGGGT